MHAQAFTPTHKTVLQNLGEQGVTLATEMINLTTGSHGNDTARYDAYE